MKKLLEFLTKIYINQFRLKCTGTCDLYHISFLDLVLTKADGYITTKTFFKETDRNSYIPTASCHHPKWLGAIPKGQSMRVCCNCAKIEDYVEQSELLINRFKEKGYRATTLMPVQTQVLNMNRQELLIDKPKKSNLNRNNMVFLTEFNRDDRSLIYRSLEKIVRKLQPILLRDKTLVDLLTKQPTFIYHRAPILRNRISPNIYNPPKRVSTFLDSTVFFPRQEV